MDIHKPKPVHNLREFLSEIMIIVIGVLITLAGEQSVEWLHWREKAHQAEVQMHADADSVFNGMVQRLEIQACQDRRLVLIRDRLIASGPIWTPMAPFYTSGPPAGSVYAHPMVSWPTTAWVNAVASTAATHLSDERLLRYSRIFAAAQRISDDQTTEHEQSSQLNVLGSPLVLTPDQRGELLRLVEGERARNRLIAYEANNSLRDFKALGWNLEAMRAYARKSLAYTTCMANGLV